MARPRKVSNPRCFSLLVDWGRNHRALGDYFELIEGPFTIAEAENVCRECRRLGAMGASVHAARAARKLYESNPRGARARQLKSSPNTEGDPMPRVIEVIVAKDGGTSIQTQGYSGNSCVAASEWIEKALGVATGEKKTAEFFEAAQSEQKVQQSE